MNGDNEIDMHQAIFGLAIAAMFLCFAAFGSWMVLGTVYDATRAQKWVPVNAIVNGWSTNTVAYQYTFDGGRYTGNRLDVTGIFTNRDDGVREHLVASIARAHRANQPITVFVNPRKPAESLVDPYFSWGSLMPIVILVLAFGGAGIALLWFLVRRLLSGRVVPAKMAIVRGGPEHAAALQEFGKGMPPGMRKMLIQSQTPWGQAVPLIFVGVILATIYAFYLFIRP